MNPWIAKAVVLAATKRSKFVLLTDGSTPEPMVIGILNEDESVGWLKRFSNAPNGRDMP